MCKRIGARIVSQLLLCLFLFGGISTAQATEPTPQWLSNEVYCLARVIYAEARNQSEQAQYDVAHSVMNRMKLNRRDFGGNTACGGAFYPGQYHGVTGKLADRWQPDDWNAWFVSLTRAWRVYTKREVPHGEIKKALYYLNPKDSSYAGKRWFEKLQPLVWSGVHRFYAER